MSPVGLGSVGGVIFDLDGTLIDSALTILEIINSIRSDRAARPAAASDIRPHLSKGGRALVRESLAEVAGDAEGDLVLFRERYAIIHQGPEIMFKEAERALEHLRSFDHPIAVCTNKPQRLARNALDHTGLRRFFDVMVAGDEGLPSKPDPAPLLETCKRLGVAPHLSVYVGDSEVDAETAARAGLKFIFASYGYPVGDPAAIARHHGIDCLSELPDVIELAMQRAILEEVA